MNAFVIGYWAGNIVLITLIPAVIGGIFRRAKEPNRIAITIAWIIAGFLGAVGIVNGDGAPHIFALILLGVLTRMRYAAWQRRTLQVFSSK